MTIMQTNLLNSLGRFLYENSLKSRILGKILLRLPGGGGAQCSVNRRTQPLWGNLSGIYYCLSQYDFVVGVGKPNALFLKE